jgi:SAM-dependent methyltransferase
MRKDYRYISSSEANLAEIELVENQWTQAWENHEKSVESVATHEQYALMEPYLKLIPTNSRILDAGSGKGEWTIFLSEQGFEVYGVDISEKTIQMLNEHFPQYHFLRADIRHMQFDEQFFDLVFSWGVFEHFEDGLGGCITEAYRVLKPQGYLCISVPFYNMRHRWRDSRPLQRWDVLEYDPKKHISTDPIRFYQWRLTIPELERELAVRGFKILNTHPIMFYEGLVRSIKYDLKFPPNTYRYRMAAAIMRRLPLKHFLSHMILTIAQKY